MKPTVANEIDQTANSRTPRWLGIAAAIICFCVICVLDIHAIFRSSNSTAPIGLIFLPIVATVFSVPAFAAGWCLGYFIVWCRSPIASRKRLAVVAGLVPLILGTWTFKRVWDGLDLSREVRQIQGMDANQLEGVLNRPNLASNKFILGAIAQNPNATAEILHRIVMLDRPELHEPMGSHFDVMGMNTKGLAVMRLVAMHANTAPEDLEKLAVSTNEYVLGDVAGNPKLSEATLRRLANHGSYLVEWGLALNSHTPKDILSSLAESRDDYTRARVASNPNTPADVLAALGKDRTWHVRSSIATNPSTPRSTIEQLFKDEDGRVRAAAIANSQTVRAP